MSVPAKSRRMTVCNKAFDRHRGPYVHFPVIHLCAKWLHDEGFKPDHATDILSKNGRIIITKSKEQQFVIL